MSLEYDPEKNNLNLLKHGITFEQGQKIWDDHHYALIKARTIDDPRYLAIGMIDSKCWSAIFTVREESISIISVRRARPEEVDIYES